MYSIPECIVIIPVHNEVESISAVVAGIGDLCHYIIVNDHSDDGTDTLCRESNYPFISANGARGKQNAVRTGIQYALDIGYQYAVTLDGDGQHPPEFIPEMLRVLRSDDADIVIGSRFLNEEKPVNAQMVGSRVLTWAIAWKTGAVINDPTSGMHAYSKIVMEDTAAGDLFCAEPDFLASEIVHGRRVKEIQVRMRERLSGKSEYVSVGRAAVYMIRVLRRIGRIVKIREENGQLS